MLFPLGPDFKSFTKNDQENTYANFTVDSNTDWQGFRILPNITVVLILCFSAPMKRIFILEVIVLKLRSMPEYFNVSSLAFEVLRRRASRMVLLLSAGIMDK